MIEELGYLITAVIVDDGEITGLLEAVHVDSRARLVVPCCLDVVGFIFFTGIMLKLAGIDNLGSRDIRNFQQIFPSILRNVQIQILL